MQKNREAEDFLSSGHFSHVTQWQPLLNELTFDTRFISFTNEEGRALLKLIGCTKQLCAPISEQRVTNEFETAFEMLEEKHQQGILNLDSKLEAAFSGSPGGYFVRLNTRSPKDGVFLLPDLRARLQTAMLARTFQDPWSSEAVAFDAACLHKAIVSSSCVYSSREAVNLLRLSQRVEADLILGQTVNDGEAGGELVARRWNAAVDPTCEVRVFVVDGRVTAISQYYKTLKVPHLVRQKKSVERLVVQVATEAHGRLQSLFGARKSFYTLDMALLRREGAADEGNFDHAIVIEINPPPPVAGTILFDWNDPADRDIILGKSSGSCVTRLVEEDVRWENIPFHPPLKAFAEGVRGRPSRQRCTLS